MSIKGQVKIILYKVMSYNAYAKLAYFKYMKRVGNIKNPKLFSEKLFWLKYYNGVYKRDLVQLCYDKNTVRDYVKDKGLGYILNEQYSVYDNADEIDFDSLPEQFVIKVSQSSGQNLICVNKSQLDWGFWKKRLNDWLIETNNISENEFDEGYLYNGKAVLVCEKLLQDENGDIPNDYRIFCFNGEPRYIVCDVGTTKRDGSHGTTIFRNCYDLDWTLQNVNIGREKNENIIINKPDNLEEMLNIARKLSEDFPFARIDLYNINNNIVFGEITWIPMGGAGKITPLSWDKKLGEELLLPDVKLF